MTTVWHPFTQMRGFTPIGRVVKAEGEWLYLEDGRRLFDGISSWWVNTHGHAHPAIAAAIAEQAARMDQVILADFTHGPAEALTEALLGVLPGALRHVFYSDNGSTSVEVALKMAWQAQRVLDPARTRIVALEGAYHGDTLLAMAVGERDVFTRPFVDLMPPVDFLPLREDAIADFFRQHGAEVAVSIAEPLVQGAAGMRMHSPALLRGLAQATRAAGALFVADEVMTGFGRAGAMFACQRAGVEPDLLCMSKGITGGAMALGATACTTALYERFLGPDKRSAFLHGHSYTGNPLACAAGVAALGLYAQERTLERVAAMEAAYRAATPEFAAIEGVRGVRALGGIFAFELDGGPGGYHDPVGARVAARALAEGLYVRPLGNTVYLMPPFCAAGDSLDAALGALHRATAAALR